MIVPINGIVVEHYDYDELNDCACLFCRAFRLSKDAYYRSFTHSSSHGQECYCPLCTETKNQRLKFIAASSKRDLYSEFSFSMRDKPDREEFMIWLSHFILTLDKSDGWWQSRSQDMPKEFWLRAWRNRANLTLAKNRKRL